MTDYQIQDAMSVWWLGGPEPRLIGAASLVGGNRKVALEYAPQWIADGFALSDDLPLARGLFSPKDNDRAAGALEDARPDRWGERVIRHIYKPARLSVLEFLYFAGDNRFGALGVSRMSDAYRPCTAEAVWSFDSLREMEVAIERVRHGDALDERQTHLVRPGPTFGGARPKSLIASGAEQWVVKFAEDDAFDVELVEHATMTLAAACGIQVAQTQIFSVAKGHAIAVRRFDRQEGVRQHVVSAFTVLRAAGQMDGYPELAQQLRRLGARDGFRRDQEELFRRMVFNILMDNTDDHHKNHAFVRGADGYYRLAPAYDVVPAATGLGYQQLRVGRADSESSLSNALSEVAAFGLKRDQAVQCVREICRGMAQWKEHFAKTGVRDRDIALLAHYIDGRLGDQRREFEA